MLVFQVCLKGAGVAWFGVVSERGVVEERGHGIISAKVEDSSGHCKPPIGTESQEVW
jgi:hypothetical protein